MTDIYPSYTHNGFELSGWGIPDRHLFSPYQSHNFASKSRSIPGPFQRMVIRRKEKYWLFIL